MHYGEHDRELMSLPIDYTVERADDYNDIIETQENCYRSNRIRVFIRNFKDGIPDKIRISRFQKDGSVIISILQYDGKKLIYTFDPGRTGDIKQFQTYFGKTIVENIPNLYETEPLENIVYYFITDDNQEFLIFRAREQKMQ